MIFMPDCFIMNQFKLGVACGGLALAGLVGAGEIVIAAPPGSVGKTSVSNATDNRIKAQAYSQTQTNVDNAVTPTTIILVPDAGLFEPAQTGRPPDNRSKARNYLKDPNSNSTDPTVILLERAPKNSEPSRANLEKNMNKARSYADGGSATGSKPGTYVRYGTAVGVVAADGVIVFACDQITNSAGRIGDDSQSGNLFTLSLNNKLLQARCK